MKLGFMKLDENAIIPKFSHPGDAGMDITSIEDYELKPNEFKPICTGLSVEIPFGYELQVRPRSGIAAVHGLSVLNTPGTIDCVPKGTKIKTTTGDMLVEDLFQQSQRISIYSYNEEKHKIEEDIVSDMWIVDDLNLIKIELEDGKSIKVPEDKLIYTKRGWINAKNLKNDDDVLIF